MTNNPQNHEYLVEEYYFVRGATAFDINENAIMTNGKQNLQEYLNKKSTEGWYLIATTKKSNNRGHLATAFDLLLIFERVT